MLKVTSKSDKIIKILIIKQCVWILTRMIYNGQVHYAKQLLNKMWLYVIVLYKKIV
jgi:hypothetical protein